MEGIYGWTSLRETVSSVTHFHYALETILVVTVITLFMMRRHRQINKRKRKVPELTEQEKDEIIDAWVPEPLVPETTQEEHQSGNQRFVDGKMGKIVSIEGKEYLNLATYNFLGFVGDKRIEEVAKKTIFKYGVGSCGPRGFYGTVDVHLDLEKDLAQYMGCEEAVLYSYGFATISSAIPAYAKRGDIIYADKGVNFAVQKGLQASRSRIEWFEHNDMDDLERLLEEQAEQDKKNPKKAKLVRRFIVVEGLYAKTADLCPLPKIMELKWKHKVRVFMDESLSFGVIGKMGKGVTEHFGVPVVDVDMIMVSLENAIASTGGFCCGRSYVVGHQRLSGLGYCFSASLPPLLASAASEALRIMSAEPSRFQRLQQNASIMHCGLIEACQGTHFRVQGIELSPIQHIVYGDPNLEKESENETYNILRESKLDVLVEELFDLHSIVVTRARYLVHEEAFRPEPSVKIMCNSEMTLDEVRNALDAIKQAIHKIT